MHAQLRPATLTRQELLDFLMDHGSFLIKDSQGIFLSDAILSKVVGGRYT
jgi:hypothetical protein